MVQAGKSTLSPARFWLGVGFQSLMLRTPYAVQWAAQGLGRMGSGRGPGVRRMDRISIVIP